MKFAQAGIIILEACLITAVPELEMSQLEVMRCLNRDSTNPLWLKKPSEADGDWSGWSGANAKANEDIVFHSFGSDKMENKDFVELEEESNRLKEQRSKFCMQNPVTVIFLLCGFLICCETSAPAFLKWPACTTHIQQCLKTFLYGF